MTACSVGRAIRCGGSGWAPWESTSRRSLGVGTAGIDPVVYGLGGTQPGLSAGEGISIVELGDMPAGPSSAAFIASLAAVTDLRLALLSIPLATLALTGATYRLRPTGQFSAADISSSA